MKSEATAARGVPEEVRGDVWVLSENKTLVGAPEGEE